MDGPPSFRSVVARSVSDPLSYSNEHAAPPSMGLLGMARLQLSDPLSYNNEHAVPPSVGSVAMAQLQLSDQFTDNTSYNNEQAPSMAYDKGGSQSTNDGFSYNAQPPSLTYVTGRCESYSGSGPTEIDSNSIAMSENNYDDASTIDLDADLSYLDEKLQHVLGHIQKDFKGGVSPENMGSMFGGYGSFFPTSKRFPAYPHS